MSTLIPPSIRRMCGWLVPLSVAVATGCMRVEARTIGDKRWELWGDDLDQFDVLVNAQPAGPADRCGYWTSFFDHPAEARLTVAIVQIGTIRISENLAHFIADERSRACIPDDRASASLLLRRPLFGLRFHPAIQHASISATELTAPRRPRRSR